MKTEEDTVQERQSWEMEARKSMSVLSGHGFLNRDVIKYMAIAAMLLNHIAHVLLPGESALREPFLDIGYFTAPVMCYFLVEGFHYTHDRKKYGERLLIFALISLYPFYYTFGSHGNMILTLFYCFLILAVMNSAFSEPVKNLMITGLAAASLFSDWPVIAPVMTLLFEKFRGDRTRTGNVFLIPAISMFLSSIEENPDSQQVLLHALGGGLGPLIAGFVILELYSGRKMVLRSRAAATVNQWFFYIFYPAHLILLDLIRLAMK